MLLLQSGPQPYKGRVCSLHEEIELSVAIPCLGSQMIMVKLGIEPSSVCVHIQHLSREATLALWSPMSSVVIKI